MHCLAPACRMAYPCGLHLHCVPQGPLVGQATIAVPQGAAAFNITFDSGLTANTDYLLRLIAADTPAGNCQAALTDLSVHTLDNVPPNTLAFEVVDIGGSCAGLQLTLDEPGTAFFAVMPRGSACPLPSDLFEAAVAAPQGAITAGSFPVPSGGTPAVVNATGLTSETNYTACVIASDATRLRNRQPAGAARDFRTLDVTPPTLSVTILPGQDANFTCDRCGLPAERQPHRGLPCSWAQRRRQGARNDRLPAHTATLAPLVHHNMHGQDELSVLAGIQCSTGRGRQHCLAVGSSCRLGWIAAQPPAADDGGKREQPAASSIPRAQRHHTGHGVRRRGQCHRA